MKDSEEMKEQRNEKSFLFVWLLPLKGKKTLGFRCFFFMREEGLCLVPLQVYRRRERAFLEREEILANSFEMNMGGLIAGEIFSASKNFQARVTQILKFVQRRDTCSYFSAPNIGLSYWAITEKMVFGSN